MKCNGLALLAALAFACAAQAQQSKPNIVVFWGDDIGQSNISAYSHGLMGYKTPNIDRVAREGMMFTDYYAEQSCTAGRASFITGQSGLRTGMTKVGVPAATKGLSKLDPTIAEVLKILGYTTGQFGKNHLGDRNEFLPTVHGFDEFYGNLYHLNAEEEPENIDYPKDPAFRAKFGPRGVLDCKASAKDDATDEPRFGKVGKQVCKDTGPLGLTTKGKGEVRSSGGRGQQRQAGSSATRGVVSRVAGTAETHAEYDEQEHQMPVALPRHQPPLTPPARVQPPGTSRRWPPGS